MAGLWLEVRIYTGWEGCVQSVPTGPPADYEGHSIQFTGRSGTNVYGPNSELFRLFSLNRSASIINALWMHLIRTTVMPTRGGGA